MIYFSKALLRLIFKMLPLGRLLPTTAHNSLTPSLSAPRLKLRPSAMVAKRAAPELPMDVIKRIRTEAVHLSSVLRNRAVLLRALKVMFDRSGKDFFATVEWYYSGEPRFVEEAVHLASECPYSCCLCKEDEEDDARSDYYTWNV
ncbi:hypothetical protein JKP88DRAFT_242406 [Tribonema minus]|uniref:Uncharacterized protein n=1 Tax=Tribonema minus TaxID=303371 RepID=A0A835YL12_9STRA|nr:hypothetical protein JKP88DRAFT_242406 [Tribonema minus]